MPKLIDVAYGALMDSNPKPHNASMASILLAFEQHHDTTRHPRVRTID
jgi:hypothetical protein